MRIRWVTFPVVAGATVVLTAAAAFGATIMVDQDGFASPNNCGGTAPAQTTIQGGVDAASPGDKVEVCGAPTPYAGAQVNTPGVKLIGLNNPIVQQPGGNAITLNADKTSISGFEIRNSGAAIVTGASFSGYKIRNNNLHDNSIGIFLASDGTFRTLITKNNIHDNNAPGSGQGNGIDNESPLSNVTINANSIVNNDNEGILLNPQTGVDSGIRILNNTFADNLGSDVAFLGTVNNSLISHNTMTNPSADPVNGNSSVFIGSDSARDRVVGNTITNPNFNGLAVRNTAHDITATGNTITGAGNNGIDVSSTAPAALNAFNNKVSNSQVIGINFQAGTTGSQLTRNQSTGSHGPFNCQDQGSNTWTGNTAAPSNPVGICN